MPEAQKIKVICEGSDDRAFLVALQTTGLVSSLFEINEGDKAKRGDTSFLVEDAEAFLKAGLSVVVVRDLDDLDAAAAAKWFQDQLKVGSITADTAAVGSPRCCSFAVAVEPATCKAVQLVLGISEPSYLTTDLGVARFAMDDYLLRMLLEKGVYEGLSELAGVTFETFHKKLPEAVRLLRANGIQVDQSKRLLQLAWGITGFRASPATFAQRLVEVANLVKGPDAIKPLVEPLAQDLNAVAALFQTSEQPEQPTAETESQE